MPNEPNWLTAADVIALNADIVAGTGEPHAISDIGLLESAVVRPRNYLAYDKMVDVVDLACILMLAIARNHPFLQGNKRAGFVAAQVFLEYNGYRLVMKDDVSFAEFMIRAIDDSSLDGPLTSLVRRFVRPIP